MRRTFLIILTGFIILLGQASYGVRVNSVYEASVPVKSQSVQDRNLALPQAIEQVLVKASGDAHILDNSKLKAQLGDASILVQQFGYSASNLPNTPYFVQIDFEPEGINKLLRDAEIPIWGVNRPLVLAWISITLPGKAADIIDSSSNSEIQASINRRAFLRGLPIIFPVMDMTDMNQVSAKEISAMNIATLLTAAKRYVSDAILVVQVQPSNEGFKAQAKLIQGDKQWDWTQSGKTAADVVAPFVDVVTDTLASRYATVVTNTVQEQVVLKVAGVSQHDDFLQLIRYLDHLPPVAATDVVRIAGDEVVLRISLRGTSASFTHILMLGKKLLPVANKPTDNALVYQWNH